MLPAFTWEVVPEVGVLVIPVAVVGAMAAAATAMGWTTWPDGEGEGVGLGNEMGTTEVDGPDEDELPDEVVGAETVVVDMRIDISFITTWRVGVLGTL